MEKALKILLMDRCDIANHKICKTEMFNEAIAELQEAMKPKMCDNCRWVIHETGNTWCGKHCTQRIDDELIDFYCNRYEPKDK